MSLLDMFDGLVDFTGNERFVDVDWYCDGCGAYLNSQSGFDDHHYTWKCTECGFKSSISKDNIKW